MDPAVTEFDERGGIGSGPSGSIPSGEGELQICDDECLRMIAFRIRETANRIAILADRVHEPELRRAIHAISERLLNDEEALQRATSRTSSNDVNNKS